MCCSCKLRVLDKDHAEIALPMGDGTDEVSASLYFAPSRPSYLSRCHPFSLSSRGFARFELPRLVAHTFKLRVCFDSQLR